MGHTGPQQGSVHPVEYYLALARTLHCGDLRPLEAGYPGARTVEKLVSEVVEEESLTEYLNCVKLLVVEVLGIGLWKVGVAMQADRHLLVYCCERSVDLIRQGTDWRWG